MLFFLPQHLCCTEGQFSGEKMVMFGWLDWMILVFFKFGDSESVICWRNELDLRGIFQC